MNELNSDPVMNGVSVYIELGDEDRLIDTDPLPE